MYNKEYYEKNKEYFRAYRHKYYLEHIEEEKKKIKIWNTANRNRINRRVKERKEKDIKYRMLVRLRNKFAAILKKYGEGKKRRAEFYGIDFRAIIAYLGPKPNDERKYHIDHIRPLASFDLTDLKQIKIAFAPENHQWLEAKANMSKGAKWDSDTLRSPILPPQRAEC